MPNLIVLRLALLPSTVTLMRLPDLPSPKRSLGFAQAGAAGVGWRREGYSDSNVYVGKRLTCEHLKL